MIELTIGIDGIPSQQRVVLGNQYENNDEQIVFEFPEEYSSYNKYMICVNKPLDGTATTVILPITDNTFIVSSSVTYLYGNWIMYAMLRQHSIDLDVENPDISAKDNEHVFIANGFIGVVNKVQFDKDSVENAPIDTNLQVLYDDMLSLKQELEAAIVGLDTTITDKVNSAVQDVKQDIEATAEEVRQIASSLNYEFKLEDGVLMIVKIDSQ